jgi:hypothetical protein
VAVTWGVGCAVAVVEGFAVAVVEGFVVGALVAVRHGERVIVLESIVTAPLRARTRPSSFAPVCRLMLVSARIVPVNVELVPRVALLPTCQ